MKKIILSLYKTRDFSKFAEIDAKQNIIKVLNSQPNLDKYCQNSKIKKNFE